jgi:hypothetical protein
MGYLFALLKDKSVIGLFNNKSSAENMMNGLINNKLCKRTNLIIDCYAANSIFKINNINTIIEEDDVDLSVDISQNLSSEDKKKIMEEKSKLEYEMNMLKKKKEEIIESKKTFKVDLELYKNFKKILCENSTFEIPDLFQNKYNVLKMLDDENKLTWENFYANYQKEELNTSYNILFSDQSARD